MRSGAHFGHASGHTGRTLNIYKYINKKTKKKERHAEEKHSIFKIDLIRKGKYNWEL